MDNIFEYLLPDAKIMGCQFPSYNNGFGIFDFQAISTSSIQCNGTLWVICRVADYNRYTLRPVHGATFRYVCCGPFYFNFFRSSFDRVRAVVIADACFHVHRTAAYLVPRSLRARHGELEVNYDDRLTEAEKEEATDLQSCVAFNWLDSNVIRSGIVSNVSLQRNHKVALIPWIRTNRLPSSDKEEEGQVIYRLRAKQSR